MRTKDGKNTHLPTRTLPTPFPAAILMIIYNPNPTSAVPYRGIIYPITDKVK